MKKFKWYLKSAEGENYGIGIKKDEKKAFQLYFKSVNEGIVMDTFQWYLKSAEGGNNAGQFNIRNCYKNGIGTTKDEKKAFQYLLRNEIVMQCLTLDKEKAFKWHLKSAYKLLPAEIFETLPFPIPIKDREVTKYTVRKLPDSYFFARIPFFDLPKNIILPKEITVPVTSVLDAKKLLRYFYLLYNYNIPLNKNWNNFDKDKRIPLPRLIKNANAKARINFPVDRKHYKFGKSDEWKIRTSHICKKRFTRWNRSKEGGNHRDSVHLSMSVWATAINFVG
ncbi:hypothetical protein Glove_66g70 [Diversispora epigaea]|uniref:Uncharacterized protein n=1 Tax=Diversispora epigaea TaxID=1348612 RepID=A0A397JLJ7_9GLOM|nr:hypothetical protein Glove_66g70 [Diversispora epigaea]